MRLLLFFMLGLFVLGSSCEKDTAVPVCSENQDYGIDVLAGPRYGPFSSMVWVYLSDEFGNINDENNSVTYPVFLNWLNPCAEKYTVNIGQQVSFPNINGGTSYFEVMNSYFGIESGQAFIGGVRSSQNEDITGGVAARTILISGIPSADTTIVLGNQTMTATYLSSTHQLKIEIPNTNLRPSTSNVMVGVRLNGDSFFRAVVINLDSQEDYTFEDFTERIVSHQVNFTGYRLKSLDLSVLLSEEERIRMELGRYYTSTNQVNIWLPIMEKPYLISYTAEYEEGGDWSTSEVVDEVPDIIHEKAKYISSVSKENEYLKFDLTNHSYVFASTEPNIIFPGVDKWTLEGPLLAGEGTVRIPPLSDSFDESHPHQNLERLWGSESFDLAFTFHHYPALNSADEYWQLSESPWRDQLQYHSITVRIE